MIAGHSPARCGFGVAGAVCAAVLILASFGAAAFAAQPGPRASSLNTSRWWRLECPAAAREPGAIVAPCVFTVKLRGAIDASRLQLLKSALTRRDVAQRALHRDIEVRIDLDTQGGEVFAALEIGQILRDQHASITVRSGASCISACVFVLMGATRRHIDKGARIGIHRPSLGAARQGGPKESGEDAIVEAMSTRLVDYAAQMNIPRRIVDEMMRIPADRVRLLRPSDLAAYGIPVLDPSAVTR